MEDEERDRWAVPDSGFDDLGDQERAALKAHIAMRIQQIKDGTIPLQGRHQVGVAGRRWRVSQREPCGIDDPDGWIESKEASVENDFEESEPLPPSMFG